jgi:hypothetical protein
MGLLNKVESTALNTVGLTSIQNRSTKVPAEFGPDFAGGFVVTEIVNRKPKAEADGYGFTLKGSFMPHVPFSFGGSQSIVKEYYPGNTEPVVQVLGPKESDLTIKGRLYTKKFKDVTLKDAATDFQQQIDGVRIRGNLLKLSMGDWHRYGYLEEVNFDLKRTADIEYTLKFSLVGFNPPKECKLVADRDDNFVFANQDLVAKTKAALDTMKNYPETMPRTLSEFLDDQISNVASAVNLVTDFIDGILSDVESMTKSANRALGLIKNAQSTISSTARRIGAIELTIASLADGFSTAADQTTAVYRNAQHFKNISRGTGGMSSLQIQLAALREKYKAFSETVPLTRHLVADGDTLQRISMRYYDNADLWKKIYDHNKLLSSNLTSGTVLEIPRE